MSRQHARRVPLTDPTAPIPGAGRPVAVVAEVGLVVLAVRDRLLEAVAATDSALLRALDQWRAAAWTEAHLPFTSKPR